MGVNDTSKATIDVVRAAMALAERDVDNLIWSDLALNLFHRPQLCPCGAMGRLSLIRRRRLRNAKLLAQCRLARPSFRCLNGLWEPDPKRGQIKPRDCTRSWRCTPPPLTGMLLP